MGYSTLYIASIAVQTAANSFLRPACAPYYEPQFRAAMMKHACHATGKRGSASKIISIAAGYGDGSSKSSAVVKVRFVVLTPKDR